MLNRELAATIQSELESIASEFSSFQKQSNLSCFEGCGKCCFKKDISCSPIELLPLAFDLLDRGEAEKTYDMLLESQIEGCPFIEIHDEQKGLGKCLEYQFRPLICRSFGVAPKRSKNVVEYSVCRTLKTNKQKAYEELVAQKKINEEAPYIDNMKSRLVGIHPAFLEEELPITESLIIILEKVLIQNSYVQSEG
jgi:uncharacterized protein